MTGGSGCLPRSQHSAFEAGLVNYEAGSQMPSLLTLHQLVARQEVFGFAFNLAGAWDLARGWDFNFGLGGISTKTCSLDLAPARVRDSDFTFTVSSLLLSIYSALMILVFFGLASIESPSVLFPFHSDSLARAGLLLSPASGVIC